MQIFDIAINQEMMETTRHGDPAFPLAIYETVLSKNVLGFVDWHWHNELQFCRVTCGQVQVTVGQTVHLLSAGMGIFINTGVLHIAKPLTEDGTYVCINVHPNLVSGFSGSILETDYIAPLLSDPSRAFLSLSPAISWQNSILEQLGKIQKEYTKKETGYEFTITSRLLSCMRPLACEAFPEEFQQQTFDSLRLKALTTYIHSHVKEKITLAELAEEVHLCPNECCRYFKKHMNCTLFEYINNVRISKSSEALLEHPELTISEIAYEYGFSTASFYIQSFKKATGKTPNKFRRNDAMKDTLGIPDGYEAQIIMHIGYIDDSEDAVTTATPRNKLSGNVSYID